MFSVNSTQRVIVRCIETIRKAGSVLSHLALIHAAAGVNDTRNFGPDNSKRPEVEIFPPTYSVFLTKSLIIISY